MSTAPCNVCGGTEVNLVDGYYYCVECGTQDVHVRETVVEQTVLADGTFAQVTSKKFTTIVQDGITMSGEWCKWHAYNFMLASLTEELISLGADPSVKMKILWIWTRYIKKFQVKESHSETSEPQEENCINNNEKSYLEGEVLDYIFNDENQNIEEKAQKFKKDIKIITKGTLLTILYIGLNLDHSDIQLSHLFRFINEERLSIYNCIKFVPKELNTKSIPYWKNFLNCTSKLTPRFIREVAMTFFKELDLGIPLVPNLTKIINNYLLELCLPLDFRDLVLALLHLLPCEFLQRSKKSFVRIPDYEGICISYLLLGLKICFGLDDDYEIRLSDAVDEINFRENYVKSYKLGFHPEPTDRLFSFRDWYTYLQFRKTILSKYYLHSAQLYNLPIDDYILMEQLENRRTERIRLSDDVTMDILNKIPPIDIPSVIPKNEFPPSLTPLTTYTEILGGYIKDLDIKLLLCEDFSQYSLKYATRDFRLPGHHTQFSINGIEKNNKLISNLITGCLKSNKSDTTLVFVRNCENHNWLKTNPPTINHITQTHFNDNTKDKESDHGYDSNTENATIDKSDDIPSEIIENNIQEDFYEMKYDLIEEENTEINIFDDKFEHYNNDIANSSKDNLQNVFEIEPSETKIEDSKFELNENNSLDDSIGCQYIDPDKIDRNNIIKELIEIACKKFRIILPKENSPDKTRKRKITNLNKTKDATAPKRRKLENQLKRGEKKNKLEDMLSVYYKSLECDLLNKISNHIKTVVESITNVSESNMLDTSHLTNIDQNNEQLSHFGMENENESNTVQNQSETTSHESVIFNAASEETNISADNVDLVPKINADYDANTHDINQLYVKLEGEFEVDDVFDIDDINLETIIDKKIEEFANNKEFLKKQTDKLKVINNLSDSDDDLPLNVLKEEKAYHENKRLSKLKLGPFLPTPKTVKKLRYWLRHYEPDNISKKLDLGKKFDMELNETCPKSFIFVISECATILNCTTFSLYRSLQYLESKFLKLKDLENVPE